MKVVERRLTAGQFDVGTHARCWVHAERLIHALDTFNDHKRDAKERIRRRLWWLYADLRAWQRNPRPERARALADRFDEERIYLLGESWGSTLGVLAAQERPDRLPGTATGTAAPTSCG